MTTFLPVYEKLLHQLGPSQWWPAESSIEIIIGAILTQNTSWKNVEKALISLREETGLEPERITRLPVGDLAQLIRSSGYYNQKAIYLRAFLLWLESYDFSVQRLRESHSSQRLRELLLQQKGIGPETADSILCYALELPFFVVDAYTFRLADRLQLKVPRRYEPLRLAVESEFRAHFKNGTLTAHLNEFHALIVRHGNTICRKRSPGCSSCSLYYRNKPAKGLTPGLRIRSCRYDTLTV